MYKKRGQATILILLGIVVLSLVVGVYFTRDYILKSELERLTEKTLVVPKQAESVRDYVMSCVQQVTADSVDLIGQRGGFFEFPGDNIPFGPYNQFSNSLEVVRGLKIPYWYYKTANNLDKLQILNEDQIGNNIEGYVNEQLRVCVGTFDVFKRSGYKINSGLIESEVEILDNNVLFGISFPVHMEIKDFEFDFTEFYSKVDKPLGELYDIARGIFNYENGKYFLEEKTIDMMVSYDEIPLTGESFSCGAVNIWNKNTIVNDFKRILSSNIPSLKILGTEHGLTEEEKEYFEVDIGSVESDVDINFMYSNSWPFYLESLQEEDGILKGESIGGGSGNKLMNMVQQFFCYNNYHFVYNIKYPVLILLEKDDYVFQFSTMVVIDRNLPRQNIIEPLDIPVVEDKEYCENKQFNLFVDVYDEFGYDVNDADISYRCINHVCELGKSTGNSLNSLVMPCVGGSVFVSKEGYNTGSTQVDTTEDASVSVVVKEIKELDVSVEVLRGGSGELRDGETVYLTLTNEEDDYGASVVYPSQDTIELISGNYKANIYMIKEGSVTVPGREVEHCVKVPKSGLGVFIGATETKCVSTKIPSVELDNVISGAAEFEFTIDMYDLKNKVVFYVPYEGTPKNFDELSKIKSEVGRDYVYPKFS